MPFETRVDLPGSERKPLSGAKLVASVQPDEAIRVTVILRRKGPDPEMTTGFREYLSRDEFAEQHGANPNDLNLVERFAHAMGLSVVESSVGKRRVILVGSAEAMSNAFGTKLDYFEMEGTGHRFCGHTSSLTIPIELQGAVVAVLGLDQRPIARPHFRIKRKSAASEGTFTPPQVAALYHYPSDVDGNGETIGIIELGGGYSTADLSNYFKSLGVAEPNISAVSVDNGKNSPGSDADGEVMLDIEIAGAIAPGANIAVYFAPNTDQGFIDAITDAVHDTTRKPSVISISWGASEDSWTQQSRTALNSALQDASTLGVTVAVAVGDSGSTDGETDGKLHVDFPASSPYALACGGTSLRGSGSTISSEVVWNEISNNEGATGGGVSNTFPLPDYQSSAGVPQQPQTNFAGRGVPDVAGDADPSTGYQILVDGQNEIVGGTSAVAPLWAALIALINQKLGRSAGFINPALYGAQKSAFRDITSGNNDSGNLGYYAAKSGWDPCTGLGSPNGTGVLQTLSSGASTVTTNTTNAAVSGKRS